MAALRPAKSIADRPATFRAPNEEDSLSRMLGAAIGTNRYGDHAAVRTWYSTPESCEASPVTLELLTRTRKLGLSKRAQSLLADSANWLFLDTETTGLAGGTGTYAFLIGLAWWDAGGLQVEQFIMRDFAEEHAILHELAARMAERPVLVTYNGKAFDWPLLDTRFRMTRAIAPPKPAAHLDLLHPARALWKLRLGSVRLVDLERNVLDPARLGWHRADDISSALIPQFYFDYLRGGPPGPLARVVRHNQMDLRGLAALFGKINRLLSGLNPECDETPSLDLFGLSRFLQRRGDSTRAHSTCSQALELGLPPEFQPHAQRDLAVMAKRHGDHAKAVVLWENLAAGRSQDQEIEIYACEQLAIHHEGREKDPLRALQFARLAVEKLRRWSIGRRNSRGLARISTIEERLSRRILRLERKVKQENAQEATSAPPLLEKCRGAVAGRGRG